MQRSFSASSANYQHYNIPSDQINRPVPIELTSNKRKDNYSSDSESHHQTYLQRTSSASSFTSTSSTGSASYRILPVRYSSVDRVIQKPPIVTANERGINVRIHFDHPRHRHHHHRHQNHHTEQHEHHHKKHRSTHQEQYESCPALNKDIQESSSAISASGQQRPSNIKYIETRSIVRGFSNDQLNKNNHSSTLIIRQQSLPPLPKPAPQKIRTRVKHIPLDTYLKFKPIITRVIREEEE